MAVASWRQGTQLFGPKDFPAPKRADLKYWYLAARRAIPALPCWGEDLREVTTINVDLIHVAFKGYGGDLWIARKRHLR